MKKLFFTLLFLSFCAEANEEHNALISCSILNRSSNEWDCMYDELINDHISYSDSTLRCFKDTPGIVLLKKHNASLDLSKLSASEACDIAIDLFMENDPSNKERLDVIKSTCSYPERNTIQWVCMATFAKYKNSFNYSAGQCFPRS